jgi:three-Cys-motif partner protein
VRSSGGWAKDKLDILTCYSNAFALATKKADGGAFIDGYAGPGLNFIRDTSEVRPGSPIIALQARFGKVFLIERNPKAARRLRDHLAQTAASEVEVVEGDVNVEVFNCLAQIESWRPVLVFLDPTRADLEWSTVERIASHDETRRTTKPELLINFPSDFDLLRKFRIGRGPAAPDRISAFFGTDEWQDLESVKLRGMGARVTAQTRKELLELYAKRLREVLGYRHGPLVRPIRARSSRGRTCYFLVFVSDHPLGEKLMRHCFGKTSDGQTQLALDC